MIKLPRKIRKDIGIPKEDALENLDCDKDSIFIVLESVEKPGNLGAILRTADAAGVSDLSMLPPRCLFLFCLRTRLIASGQRLHYSGD